jgi:hypothetical protein
VMQGVGRVVWKRDASGASPDAPAGMGVKFIKLDEESKAVIDRLVGTRGSKDGAYDVGERTSQPAAEPTAQAIKIPRKGTMIGLGAVSPAESPARASTPAPEAREPEEKPSEGFFPSGGPVDQHPPEDRTVMRQAAELLRDALIEAGGSMEEIGSTGAAPVVAAPHESTDVAKHVSVIPPAASVPPPRTTEKVASAAVASDTQSTKPPPADKFATTRSSRPTARVEQRPLPSSVPASAQKGGSKPALMLLGVAAIGGGLFWLTQQSKPPDEPAPPQAEPAVVAPPAPEPIASTEAPAVASAAPPEPSASAAPPVEETAAEKATRIKAEAAAKKAEEEAAKKAADEAKKAEAAAKKAEEASAKKAADEAKKAELEAKKAAAAAAAAAAPKPAAPRPKPAAPKPPPAAETPPSEVPPPPAPPAEKPPEAVKPAAPTPAPAPVPTTAPAPAPKEPPKEAPPAPPKAPESDNPY